MKLLKSTIARCIGFILADYLVETLPTANTVFAWSNRAMKRYDALRSITDAACLRVGKPIFRLNDYNIYADSASLFRFVRTTYSKGVLANRRQKIFNSSVIRTRNTSLNSNRPFTLSMRMLDKSHSVKVEQASKKLTRSADKLLAWICLRSLLKN